MNNKIKFEGVEEQARYLPPNDDDLQYEFIFNKFMEFTTRRRLDASNARARGDLMDCSQVAQEEFQ